MKITKTASGTKKITMSKSEWLGIGRQAGWVGNVKTAQSNQPQGTQNEQAQQNQTPNNVNTQEVFGFCRAITPICEGLGDIYKTVRNSSYIIKGQKWDQFNQNFKSQYEERYITNSFKNLEKFNGKVLSKDGWKFDYNQTGFANFLSVWNKFFQDPQNNIDLLRNAIKSLETQLTQIHNSVMKANPQIAYAPIKYSFIEE
jgi:hypothetical protein